MGSKEIVREFLSALNAEEKLLIPVYASDNFGVGITSVIKELDWYFYNDKKAETTFEQIYHFYFLSLAVPQIIKNTFQYAPAYEHPGVVIRKDSALRMTALNLIGQVGFIEHGKRMAYLAMAEECSLIKVGPSSFEFILPAELYDYESHESSIEDHYIKQAIRLRDRFLNQAYRDNGTFEHLEKVFNDNVYAWQGDLIGYEAHPDLDDYYFGIAYSELQFESAHDAFNHQAQFGGLKYYNYWLTLVYFYSIALKHEKFADALIKKDPSINFFNILTITADKVSFIQSIETVLNSYGYMYDGYRPITFDEAEILYKVLSIRRDNLELLDQISSVPFITEFSDRSFIKSIAGAQYKASEFLLESLKFNFPKDYQRNQAGRELSLQKAVERLLLALTPNLQFRRNIHIRKDGRVLTDIDLVAYDEHTKAVVFFQLKHQDHYGIDVKKRSSRSAKLKDEVENWVSVVNTWLETSSSETINACLQLRKSVNINSTFLVVLSKNFAHFLSPLSEERKFAYCSWLQFFDAFNRTKHDYKADANILNLIDVLKEFSTHAKAEPISAEDTTYHLTSLEYSVRQFKK